MRYRALSDNPGLLKGFPDMRGWEVRTAAGGDTVGRVVDILVGACEEPCYVEVEVAGPLTPKHVLLPVSLTVTDVAEAEQQPVVLVRDVTADELTELPEYPGYPSTITEDYEAEIHAACGRAATDEAYSGG